MIDTTGGGGHNLNNNEERKGEATAATDAFGGIIEEEEKAEEYQEVVDYPARTLMPHLRDPNDRPGLWKLLKSAVGKDISKFSVPVYINEPISMVQKVAEIMEYE